MTNRVRRMLQRLKGLVASLDRSDILELEPDITGTLFGDKSNDGDNSGNMNSMME